ncbi:MAG: DsrE family protein [Agarilytica sp.]
MKHIVSVILVLISFSHSANAEIKKVVFHIDQKEKGSYLVRSVGNFVSSNPNAKVVVVVNNTAVLRLYVKSKLSTKFTELMQQGVDVGVCNNAIIANEVDAASVIPGVKFLKKGGVTRIIELQSQGYAYIKI